MLSIFSVLIGPYLCQKSLFKSASICLIKLYRKFFVVAFVVLHVFGHQFSIPLLLCPRLRFLCGWSFAASGFLIFPDGVTVSVNEAWTYTASARKTDGLLQAGETPSSTMSRNSNSLMHAWGQCSFLEPTPSSSRPAAVYTKTRLSQAALGTRVSSYVHGTWRVRLLHWHAQWFHSI